jgi:hypothetical protein
VACERCVSGCVRGVCGVCGVCDVGGVRCRSWVDQPHRTRSRHCNLTANMRWIVVCEWEGAVECDFCKSKIVPVCVMCEVREWCMSGM